MRFWVWFGVTGLLCFFPVCFILVGILLAMIFNGLTLSVILLLVLLALFHWSAFLWTVSTFARAEWLLLIESYSADFNPKERWWRRLVKQIRTTPDLNRLDILALKLYAYWPWMLMLPWEWLWKLFVALGTVLRRKPWHLQSDESVDLLDRELEAEPA